MHDFPDEELGKVTPYGSYDLTANTGWVNVGSDHDTGAFAVASIRSWWNGPGRAAYPGARRLLVTADSGGADGSRLRLWKTELAAFAAKGQPGHHRAAPAAGNQQVEQNRTPAVLRDHHELAGTAADLPRSHHRDETDRRAGEASTAILPQPAHLAESQVASPPSSSDAVHAPDKARRRRGPAARDARVQRWAEDSGNAALMGRELPPAEALAADQRSPRGRGSWKSRPGWRYGRPAGPRLPGHAAGQRLPPPPDPGRRDDARPDHPAAVGPRPRRRAGPADPAAGPRPAGPPARAVPGGVGRGGST